MTEPAAADLVLTGGSVMTMDAVRRDAAAVAVRDGRIVAVGQADAAAAHIGPRTRVVELAGKTVLPSFQDAHIHPVLGGLGLLRCPLHEVAVTPAAYVEAIAAYAAAQPDLAWVEGDGWYMAAFPGGTPRREDLDRAVPDRPAFFMNRDGHGAWVNSRALALAGIDRDTPDPADGRIERDPDGSPTGTLHEGAANLVARLIPPATAAEKVEGLRRAQAYLHALGITAWQDAWVAPDDLTAYRTFAERGDLTARAIACLWWERDRGAEQIEEFVEARRVSSIGRLRVTTVKIMLDGVMENYTASMLHPYLDRDGHPTTNRGIDFVDPVALRGFVTRLDALGFQVHMHALGDRAVRQGLDAVEAARAANGPSDNRHHLAHIQAVDPADWPRFRALGAVANMQPLWAARDDQMLDLTLPFVTEDRWPFQYPFKSLRRAGAILAGGSDWTVSTPNVLMEVETAVNRVSPYDRDRPPLGAEEAIDLVDALAAFTIGSAYVNHLDDVTGSIEVSKLADLVVLDRNVQGEDRARIGDARVLLTLMEGQPVYDAGSL
ncbi:MAG TPA: amidohydrolase [Candidatus Acidoferrum sp.]|nr:amidohydrolase [Candidatus Acidoferrum sp.]